jgi:hypothetical protein
MPRRHDNLFDAIASFSALHAAARRAIKGKRKVGGPFTQAMGRKLKQAGW